MAQVSCTRCDGKGYFPKPREKVIAAGFEYIYANIDRCTACDSSGEVYEFWPSDLIFPALIGLGVGLMVFINI